MNSPIASRPRGVLVVDDEQLVLNMVADALSALGFRVWRATGGAEAIEVVRRHAGDIGAALVDLHMPGMGGEDVLAALQNSGAGMPVCLMGGCVEDPDELLRAGAA